MFHTPLFCCTVKKGQGSAVSTHWQAGQMGSLSILRSYCGDAAAGECERHKHGMHRECSQSTEHLEIAT